VEVKIQIQSVPRELVIETDETQAEVERRLEQALAAYTGSADQRPSPVFALTGSKGDRVLIPADKIAFIEFSTDQARKVGFGNIV
jgi:hypothetical protein